MGKRLKVWHTDCGVDPHPIIDCSVRELCQVDHGGDAATIKQWVEEGVRAFRAAAFRYYVVDDFIVLGVCAMDKDGRIVTNYVSPAGVGMGVGKFMMDALERTARFMVPVRLIHVTLMSTATARHFYRRRGYKEAGPPHPGAGVSWNHPLIKTL